MTGGPARSRTVVVTGGSSGIGLAAAVELARRGDTVVLLGRHPSRLATAAERVRDAGGRAPLAVRADFERPDEVHRAADEVLGAVERVDVLVNNAGALFRGATPTGDDRTMQVNHLAGFVFAHRLLDRLRAAATPDEPARLVTTASLAEMWGTLDVDRPLRRSWAMRSRWLAYGASKQANVLFTVEAARRWGPLGILPTVHFPGLIRSRFGTTSPLFMLGKLVPVLFGSAERGADTLVWLATAPPSQLVPGGYYFRRAPMAASPRATDAERARRLWDASLLSAGLDASAPPGPGRP